MKKLVSDTRIAYTAGFIEADGCFNISSSPTIRITNKHIPTLQRFVDWWGGSIRSKVQPPDCWEWNLSGPAVVPMIDLLMPYLMMKKDSAQCLLDFRLTIGARGRRITAETKLVRESIIQRLRDSRV